MRLLTFLLQHSRGGMALAILAGALSGLASTALLAVINGVLHDEASWGLGRTGLLALFGALCVLVPLARVTSSFLLVRLGQTAVHEMRLRLTRRILRTPLRHLERLGPHRLLAVLTDDLNTATDALVTLPVLVMNLFVLVGCLAYMAYLSWPLVLAVLGFLGVVVVSYQLPLLYSLRRLRVAREEEDVLFQHFNALTRGTKELKLHGRRQHDFTARVEGTSALMRRLNVFAETILAVTASWGQMLVFLVVGLVLFFGAELFAVERATLVGYTLVILYMMTPTQVVMNSVPTLGRASVAVNKVERLGFSLDREKEEPRPPATEPRPAPWQTLELRGVEFRFGTQEHDFLLGPLDLAFQPGETVFLVGGNGSGKTTLLKMLVGLYDPDRGEVLLDGRPVDPSSNELRERFSVVFSDFFLFETLLGLGDATLDERALEHLRRLEMEGKVTVRDGSLSTLDLSQGQRKRLALLTAYLEDRPVYVFDEWAADQDPYFTEVFYRELLPELKARGKTVFAASHDDRYFHVADRLVKMEFGQVQLDRRLAGLDTDERQALLAHADLGALR